MPDWNWLKPKTGITLGDPGGWYRKNYEDWYRKAYQDWLATQPSQDVSVPVPSKTHVGEWQPKEPFFRNAKAAGFTEDEAFELWDALMKGTLPDEDAQRLEKLIKTEQSRWAIEQGRRPTEERFPPWGGEVGRSRGEAADWARQAPGLGAETEAAAKARGETIPESWKQAFKGLTGKALLESWGPEAVASAEAMRGPSFNWPGLPDVRRSMEDQKWLAMMFPKEWAEFMKIVPPLAGDSGYEQEEQAQWIMNSPEYKALVGKAKKAIALPPTPPLSQVYKGAMPEFESPNMKAYYESQAQPLYQEWLATDPIKGLLQIEDPAVRESMKMTEFGKYMKQYPWLEKYTEKTAGGRTTKERPTTRWLNY